MHWLELLEGRLRLNQEKVCESWVPILATLFLVSPGSGDDRGKSQQKVKSLIYNRLKREKVKEEGNCLSMMKGEEGVGLDVGLPSCRICRFSAPGA